MIAIRRRWAVPVLLLLALLLLVGVVWAQAGGFTLRRSTVSSAGTGALPLRSADFQARVTLGQPAPVGFASGGDFQVRAGYMVEQPEPWIPSQQLYMPLVGK